MDVGSLLGRIELDDLASSKLRSFTVDLGKVGDKLDSIGRDMSRAGSALSLGITAPLVAAAAASLTFSARFEASMTRLSSLAGVAGGRVDEVKQHILDLAPAVGVGPQALVDAMTKISSTTDNTTVALSILDIAAKGSAAGMGEAVDVAGALTAVVNSYGSKAISAAQASDILTQAVKDGGAEAKELAPTLANVVPMAAQLGITFQEVAANIATFTKLGVPATEAVTSLSSVMSGLLKETKQGGEALMSINGSAKNAADAYAQLRAQIKDKGLAATLADLSEKFKDNKTGLADVFGRIEALRNVMGTAGQQAETYAKEIKEMNKAYSEGGQTQAAYQAMQGKQVQTWNQLTALAGALAIKVGDALAPSFASALKAAKPLLDFAISAVEWFGKLPQPIQTLAIGITAFVAAAGPMLMVVGGIASGVAALLPLLPAMGTALAIATGPVGAIALAVTGLVFAVQHFRENLALIEKGSNVGQPLKDLKDGAGNAIVPINQVNEKLQKLGQITSGELPNGFSTTIEGFKKTAAAAAVSTGRTVEQVEAAKKYSDALKEVNQRIAEATRDVGKLSPQQEIAIKQYQRLGLSVEDIATKLNISKIAVKAFEESLEIAPKLYNIEHGVVGIGEGLEKIGRSYDESQLGKLADSVMAAENSIRLANFGIDDMAEGLEKVGHQFAATQNEMDGFAVFDYTTWGPQLEKLERKVVSIKGLFASIPETIAAAFTGGGGMSGAVKAITSMFGGGLGQNISTALTDKLTAGGTKALGPFTSKLLSAIPGIGSALGALVGPALGALKNLLMGGAEHVINPIRQTFIDGFATATADGLSVLNAKAAEVGMTLDHLLNAKNQEQYKAAVDELNGAFERQGQYVAGVNTEIGSLLSQGEAIGFRLPAAMEPAVQKLIDMGRLTGENAALFASFTGSTEVNFSKMQSIAQKYGGDLHALGPAFESARLHDLAGGIINDFDILARGLGDTDTVLQFMKKPINDLVNESLKFGVDIPANMKPWVDQLLLTGQLTDASGDKLEDVSGLKFAAPIVTEFDKIVAKLQELIDKLTHIPDVDFNINGHYNGPELPRVEGPDYASIGARITSEGVQYLSGGGNVIQGPWQPRGTDTEAAMLTPNEGVVTVGGMQRLGNEGLRQLNSGGDWNGGDDELRGEIAALRADTNRLISQLPNDITRSLRYDTQLGRKAS